ncbi:MAG TPA: methyl-accepting chemotaxis protein [Candidatus Wunengus sp. YC63]|uniref:methyl-accepting chemotaxis protein n=1 Tax=Candidatus Wunengus sp. YC63 TaxID=3367699 RepID=UPI0040281393
MKITLNAKIITLFVIAGLLPFIITGVLSYQIASKSLRDQSFNQLVSVRDLKKRQIEGYFERIRADIAALSEDPTVCNAMKEMKRAFEEVGAEKTHELYVTKNPFKKEKKIDYLNAIDGSEYSSLHALYHPYFKGLLEKCGYYDIFLIDPETGNIIYSAYKELDFGSNLINGPYANTNIAKLYKEVNNTAEHNVVTMIDFEPYAPSDFAPASFIATPISDGFNKTGILVLQIPIDQINNIMMERAGLGKTGETYLVGSDKFMRSDSRFSDKRTILVNKIDTDAVRDALSNKSDCKVIKDYRGSEVLSAYTPLDIKGMKWAIIAEIDKKEAFSAAVSLKKWNFIIGIAAVLFVVGLGWIVLKITGKISGLFKRLLADLTEGSSQVASAAGQISESSQSLADGSAQQAASIEETSSAMEEISSMVNQNADNAKEAASLANLCNTSAEQSDQAMGMLNTAINEISGSSKQIANIIKVIDEIAFQTNLLALNAAVEAARAGEHGKGFAVVAEEVRNLAQRSANAAKETTQLIEDSGKKVNVGVDLTKKVEVSLKEIVKNVRKVTNLVNEIANASQEQSEGVGQVGKAISQMDQVIQQNAANAEETASASEELSAQAQSLLSLVDRIAGEVGNKEEEETKENKPLITKKPSAKNERVHNKPSIPNKKISHNRLNDEHIVHMKRNGNGNGQGNGKKNLAVSDADEIFPMNDEAFKDF